MPRKSKLGNRDILNEARRLSTLIRAMTGASGPHNFLSATHSDTTTQGATRGSIIYGNASPAWDELAVGAADQVLQTDGTDVLWAALDFSQISGNITTHTHADATEGGATISATAFNGIATVIIVIKFECKS